MFGGLIEVTKESSELFVFDIETLTWTFLKSREQHDGMKNLGREDSLDLAKLPGTESISEIDSRS